MPDVFAVELPDAFAVELIAGFEEMFAIVSFACGSSRTELSAFAVGLKSVPGVIWNIFTSLRAERYARVVPGSFSKKYNRVNAE